MSRNPFGWNYPAGAEHDPNAPWNQVEPDVEECPECEGSGTIWDDQELTCDTCEGTGEIVIDADTRAYEDACRRADHAYDELKDARAEQHALEEQFIDKDMNR